MHLDDDGECHAKEMVMVFISICDRHGESKTQQNKYTKRRWCTKKKRIWKKMGQKTHLKIKVFLGGGIHIR